VPKNKNKNAIFSAGYTIKTKVLQWVIVRFVGKKENLCGFCGIFLVIYWVCY
jgi:hypothetical protein